MVNWMNLIPDAFLHNLYVPRHDNDRFDSKPLSLWYNYTCKVLTITKMRIVVDIFIVKDHLLDVAQINNARSNI